MSARFAPGAARLAGLAGALLGWRPDEFWAATPEELATVMAAMAGPTGEAADADDVARLKEMFPMEDEIDRLVIAVRADTSGFARDVATLKGALEQNVGSGAERAARGIEAALGRAVRTGKIGFDDLGAVAVRAMDQIAGAAIRAGIGSLGGGKGLTGLATTLVSSLLGLPGRATGGPVSPGAAYLVGERGPELFVPTSSGAIAPQAAERASREVKVSIAIQAGAGEAPQALTRSGRQVARAVARALAQAEE